MRSMTSHARRIVAIIARSNNSISDTLLWHTHLLSFEFLCEIGQRFVLIQDLLVLSYANLSLLEFRRDRPVL